MIPYDNKLAEEVLHSLEDILILDACCTLEVWLLGELLDNLALLLCKLIRDGDIHNHHDIATAVAIYIG